MRFIERNLLSGSRDLDHVRAALESPATLPRRYPAASDREAWSSLPNEVRARLLCDGEQRLTETWEAFPASVLLDFRRHGNRVTYQELFFQRRSRLHELVLAECIEGRGRFLDAIADGIWLTCEETWWGLPAHLQEQKAGLDLPDITEPIVDLGVGEAAALLAWIDHVLGEPLDTVSKLIRPRMHREIHRQLIDPALERDDFWWQGWDIRQHTINNWNPWINSNWLACVLLIEDDADRRARAVHKIMRSLDRFINHQPEDGGCDEGPVYWGRAGGSLYDCLELLHHATSGRISIFEHPLIKNTGRFIMSAHIHGDWLVNFADAAAKGDIDGALVQRYGRQIDDPALTDFGSWIREHQKNRPNKPIRSINRSLAALFDSPIVTEISPPPLLRDVWLPDLQVAVARSRGGSSKGFFLAAKGGHNNESHNHNDVGSFIVHLNGEPLLIDVGVEVYTAKTFSPQRYEIWTMQSQWHNLPTINGAMQHQGESFTAHDLWYTADDTAATFSLDIAGAYPESASVRRYVRTFHLDRNGPLSISDDFELDEALEPIVWNFILHSKPDISSEGKALLSTVAGTTAVLQFQSDIFTATCERQAITDKPMASVWGDQIYRLRLSEKRSSPAAKRSFTLRF